MAIDSTPSRGGSSEEDRTDTREETDASTAEADTTQAGGGHERIPDRSSSDTGGSSGSGSDATDRRTGPTGVPTREDATGGTDAASDRSTADGTTADAGRGRVGGPPTFEEGPVPDSVDDPEATGTPTGRSDPPRAEEFDATDRRTGPTGVPTESADPADQETRGGGRALAPGVEDAADAGTGQVGGPPTDDSGASGESDGEATASTISRDEIETEADARRYVSQQVRAEYPWADRGEDFRVVQEGDQFVAEFTDRGQEVAGLHAAEAAVEEQYPGLTYAEDYTVGLTEEGEPDVEFTEQGRKELLVRQYEGGAQGAEVEKMADGAYKITIDPDMGTGRIPGRTEEETKYVATSDEGQEFFETLERYENVRASMQEHAETAATVEAVEEARRRREEENAMMARQLGKAGYDLERAEAETGRDIDQDGDVTSPDEYLAKEFQESTPYDLERGEDFQVVQEETEDGTALGVEFTESGLTAVEEQIEAENPAADVEVSRENGIQVERKEQFGDIDWTPFVKGDPIEDTVDSATATFSKQTDRVLRTWEDAGGPSAALYATNPTAMFFDTTQGTNIVDDEAEATTAQFVRTSADLVNAPGYVSGGMEAVEAGAYAAGGVDEAAHLAQTGVAVGADAAEWAAENPNKAVGGGAALVGSFVVASAAETAALRRVSSATGWRIPTATHVASMTYDQFKSAGSAAGTAARRAGGSARSAAGRARRRAPSVRLEKNPDAPPIVISDNLRSGMSDSSSYQAAKARVADASTTGAVRAKAYVESLPDDAATAGEQLGRRVGDTTERAGRRVGDRTGLAGDIARFRGRMVQQRVERGLNAAGERAGRQVGGAVGDAADVVRFRAAMERRRVQSGLLGRQIGERAAGAGESVSGATQVVAGQVSDAASSVPAVYRSPESVGRAAGRASVRLGASVGDAGRDIGTGIARRGEQVGRRVGLAGDIARTRIRFEQLRLERTLGEYGEQLGRGAGQVGPRMGTWGERLGRDIAEADLGSQRGAALGRRIGYTIAEIESRVPSATRYVEEPARVGEDIRSAAPGADNLGREIGETIAAARQYTLRIGDETDSRKNADYTAEDLVDNVDETGSNPDPVGQLEDIEGGAGAANAADDALRTDDAASTRRRYDTERSGSDTGSLTSTRARSRGQQSTLLKRERGPLARDTPDQRRTRPDRDVGLAGATVATATLASDMMASDSLGVLEEAQSGALGVVDANAIAGAQERLAAAQSMEAFEQGGQEQYNAVAFDAPGRVEPDMDIGLAVGIDTNQLTGLDQGARLRLESRARVDDPGRPPRAPGFDFRPQRQEPRRGPADPSVSEIEFVNAVATASEAFFGGSGSFDGMASDFEGTGADDLEEVDVMGGEL